MGIPTQTGPGTFMRLRMPMRRAARRQAMKCAGSRLQNLISLSCDRPGSGGTMRPPPPFTRPRQTFAGRIMWSSFTHYGSETFLCSEVIQCIYCVSDASESGKLLGTGGVHRFGAQLKTWGGKWKGRERGVEGKRGAGGGD